MNNKHLKTDSWQAFCLNILSRGQESLPTMPININDNAAFINHLKSNGIEALLLDVLEKQHKTALLAEDITDQMRRSRRISSVKELYAKQNLQQTIEIFNNNDIHCLILKGSALAYSLYQQPYQRIRGDTDILIRLEDKVTVDSLLVESGYEKSVTVSGNLISHQSTYTKTDDTGSHIYDLHWRLSNRNAFALLFDFDELYQHREIIRQINDNAYRLSNTDALLHAIIHYYGHFPGDRERLIWIYDMHLLCSQLTDACWSIFVQQCNTKKLEPLAIKALILTQASFNTYIPDPILHKLKQSPIKLNKIEQRRLVATKWSRIEQFRSDWAALTLSQRCQLIREYLLPPSEFILAQNHSTNKLLLPYFYCKRLLLGGVKIIKNTR